MRHPPRSTLVPYTTLFRSYTLVGYVVGMLQAGVLRAAWWIPVLTAFGASALGVLTLACNIRSEEHSSELQSHGNLVCRLLLEKKNISEDHHVDLPLEVSVS